MAKSARAELLSPGAASRPHAGRDLLSSPAESRDTRLPAVRGRPSRQSRFLPLKEQWGGMFGAGEDSVPAPWQCVMRKARGQRGNPVTLSAAACSISARWERLGRAASLCRHRAVYFFHRSDLAGCIGKKKRKKKIKIGKLPTGEITYWEITSNSCPSCKKLTKCKERITWFCKYGRRECKFSVPKGVSC